MKDRLFVAVHATCLAYCDISREVNGDYLCVARLPYKSLELEVLEPKHDLLPEIKADAARLIARRGDKFEVSTSGQYVVLGE